jgi:hypothetical protein
MTHSIAMQLTRLACIVLSFASVTFVASPQGLGQPASAPLRPAVLLLDSPSLERPRTRTLRAHDFTRHTLSLRTGAFGKAIQAHQVVNIDSELDYGTYTIGQFTAGIQGSQVGELLDLGSVADLAQRYGYVETVGGGQGFASIRFENGELVILDDFLTGSVQPFPEGQQFLQAAPPAYSSPAPVHAGHLYLVRITDRSDPAFLRFAKLQVTAHRPDEEVSFVWTELRL